MSASQNSNKPAGRGETALGVRFVLLALVSFAAMLLDHREGHLIRVRQALSIAVYPVQVVVDLPFELYAWTKGALVDRSRLMVENDELSSQLLDAEFKLQQLEALEAENSRLRALLDSTARLEDRRLVAEILSVDLDPYRQRFLLNRGGADDVFVGQAILGRNGVIGQVVNVGWWTAEAVLITDPDHAIPVVVNRNGLRTIAVGTGDQGRLRLPYLTNSADVEIGDLLVSSGMGDVFPAGYPVGRVLEIQTRPGQAFADVIAEPVSELDRDQEVLLVFSGAQEVSGGAKSQSIAEVGR
jgi:rod shape-determining protein MreC